MDALDVSVVLLAPRDYEILQKALAHLEQQSYPAARFEILIIDPIAIGESSDLLTRAIAGSPARIRVIPSQTTCVAASRNLGIREARGRWILFLDAELLASPRLVEQHVRAQEQHGGECVVVGKVELHPQSLSRGVVRHRALSDSPRFSHNQPLRFLDWRCWNLSASREAVLQNQGFDETFDVPGLEDVEFAWRLEEAGLQGFYSDAASAYAWHAVPVDLELARRYAEGFSLLRALDKTRSDVLANRYLGKGRRPWRAPGWMIAPFFRNVCGTTAGKVKPIAWICRRMEQYAVLQGYSDARRGRPPRYRAQLR